MMTQVFHSLVIVVVLAMNPTEISNLNQAVFDASHGRESAITIKRGIPTVYNRDDIFCQVMANRKIRQPEGCSTATPGNLTFVSAHHCFVAIDTYKIAPKVPASQFINTYVTMIVYQRFNAEGKKEDVNPPQRVSCLIVDVRDMIHSRNDKRMVIDMNPGNQIGGGACQHLGMCWIPGIGYQTQEAFKSYIDRSREFEPQGVGTLEVTFTYDLQQLN